MCGERFGVAFTECVEKRGRALDVGEEEVTVPRQPLGLAEVEGVVLIEDLPLEPLQGRAWFDPELVDDCPPSSLVDVEGICLAAYAVEREHQLRAETFAERVLGYELFELRDARRGGRRPAPRRSVPPGPLARSSSRRPISRSANAW